MIQRLGAGEQTAQDLTFYAHELHEADLMDQGVEAREAHMQTLKWQQIPYEPGYEAKIYAPSVIRAMPDSFSPAAQRAAGVP
jgi:hypothetical protein